LVTFRSLAFCFGEKVDVKFDSHITKAMKAKHMILAAAAAAFAIAGGLWLARSNSRINASGTSSMAVEAEVGGPSKDARSHGEPKGGHTLRPPDHLGRFRDFTPEKRVEFARKGSGPGG
jgi:hypothetical protein